IYPGLDLLNQMNIERTCTYNHNEFIYVKLEIDTFDSLQIIAYVWTKYEENMNVCGKYIEFFGQGNFCSFIFNILSYYLPSLQWDLEENSLFLCAYAISLPLWWYSFVQMICGILIPRIYMFTNDFIMATLCIGLGTPRST
ncbi:hypothetical protein ACJX0J_025980, partial [Zea mays]